MVGQIRFIKLRTYPRPHDEQLEVDFGLESGVENKCTIFSIAFYDEAQGAPSLYNANPEHASFAEYGGQNCYPDSRIDNIYSSIRISMTKAALETDKIHSVRYAYMPINMSFVEDYTAADELSSAEIEDVIEMQHELTDRQGWPLYNGVDMKIKHTGSATMHADIAGLTTDQKMEGVTFNPALYYDTLHYRTTSGKLKNVQRGLKWNVITKQQLTRTHNFHIVPKTKFMNPYTFFGVMVYVPSTSDINQIHVAGDTTDISHLHCDFRTRYNEWHQGFNHEKV